MSDTTDIQLTASPAPGKPPRFLAVARWAEVVLQRDTIDLNSSVSRNRFVVAVMRAAFPGVAENKWPDEVRRGLEAKLLAFATVPPGSAEPDTLEAVPAADDPRPAALEQMPAEVRAEAEEVLAAPKLAQRIAKDIASAVRGWLKELDELDELGVIEQTEEHRGNVPSKWKLTGKDSPSRPGGIAVGGGGREGRGGPDARTLDGSRTHRAKGLLCPAQ